MNAWPIIAGPKQCAGLEPFLNVSDRKKSDVAHNQPDAGDDAAQVYSIGALARELDTTARTIRFYEAKGLIAPQRNGVSRIYSRRDRARLIIIMRGRRLGFSLEEIGEYLSLYDAAPDQRAQLRHLNMKVTATMTDLKRKLVDIQATLAELEDIQQRCDEALEGLEPAATSPAA